MGQPGLHVTILTPQIDHTEADTMDGGENGRPAANPPAPKSAVSLQALNLPPWPGLGRGKGPAHVLYPCPSAPCLAFPRQRARDASQAQRRMTFPTCFAPGEAMNGKCPLPSAPLMLSVHFLPLSQLGQ